MHFHVVAVDEAEHVDAGGLVEVDGGVAVDGLAADEASHDVDDLQGGFTQVADGPVGAVEVGEGLGGLFVGAVALEHQAEAVGVVACAGLEGVARGLEQVDVHAGHIVDEVEVIHLHVLGLHGEGVGAVLAGLEADGHLGLVGAANDGVILIALWDVELGAVRVELELGQLAAFVETDDSIVDNTATLAGDIEFHTTTAIIRTRWSELERRHLP